MNSEMDDYLKLVDIGPKIDVIGPMSFHHGLQPAIIVRGCVKLCARARVR